MSAVRATPAQHSTLPLRLSAGGERLTFGRYNYVFARETILESRTSDFHNITVAQSGALRMLRFDMLGVEGIIHLDEPQLVLFDYMRLQLLCLVWNASPERVLVIGLGAGVLPRIIHYLSPSTHVDVVELDAEVIALARKYFLFEEDNTTRVFVTDGRRFLERQRSNHYDAILIDANTAYGRIPHDLRTIECLAEYLRVLKQTGVLLANYPFENESRYRETYARARFKHVYRGTLPENYVLIGLHADAKVFDRNELRIRARVLQHSRALPEVNWAEEVANVRNANEHPWNRSAVIFTDQVPEDDRNGHE